VARDVTELEEMRARLAVTDRMASIGTLAAGVAHEINNPLSYVMANVDFLRRFLARLRRAGLAADGGGPGPGPGPGRADGLEEAEAAVADALDGAERVREIVRDLRVLSRPGDEERTRLDLRRVVDTAASMVAHEVRHRARLVKEYRAPPAVLANDGRLTQVLLNLLVNAAHAIPEGQLARNEIRVVVGGTAEEAVVEVRDTGCGIAPELLARVFEPFFTTKPVGVGTGLGLSICHRIVADLGGSIEVESAPGQGTLFRVRLPAAPPLPPAAPEEAAPPAAEPGRARVLVVDDDARCARSLERLLGATHDVSTATSPADALTAIAGGARYDAILCDMMMPGLDGQAFYEELGEVAPELTRRVVFMSGGTFTERTEAFLRRTTAPTLEKPLLVPALRAAIDLVSAR
jgi:CheY-like chemotaxis protein